MDTQKRFAILLVGTLAFLLALALSASYLLHEFDIPYSREDAIRKYQFAKLAHHSAPAIIVVGGSEAGNEIDAALFTELSGETTLNLGLGGSFGFTSSYNLIRHAAKKGVRYVIISFSLDIWSRPLSVGGYFDTLGDLPNDLSRFLPEGKRVSHFQYLFDLHEIWWYLENKVAPRYIEPIEHDYIAQDASRTYANGVLIDNPERVINPVIDPGKIRMFHAIDELCGELKITCVYMHGTIHEGIAARSGETIGAINEVILNARNIIPSTKVFAYPSEFMGDSQDHIDISYKSQTTRDYFSMVKFLFD